MNSLSKAERSDVERPDMSRPPVDRPQVAPRAGAVSSFGRELILKAIADSFRKLSPRTQFRNPVMFVVFVCSVLTSLLWVQALTGRGEAPPGVIFWGSVWLLFTLLFANFAEALAEGRGKAQAASLRSSRKDVVAKKLAGPYRDAAITCTPSNALRTG